MTSLFCRELEQLHEMIHDVHQKVDVKPWTIEPEIDATKYGETL